MPILITKQEQEELTCKCDKLNKAGKCEDKDCKACILSLLLNHAIVLSIKETESEVVERYIDRVFAE